MNAPWSADFSYEYFKKILKAAKAQFQFHLFSEAPNLIHKPEKRILFLRHDIDVDLDMAVAMATIEEQHEVRSTYMIMLNSPFYKLEAHNSRKAISQLNFMGHEIGLHFDLEAQKKVNTNLTFDAIQEDIHRDIKRLEEIVEGKVHSISFHRPISQFLRGPLKIGELINAYSRELMGWYLSDSEGRWREGEPIHKLISPKGNLLQLLIHPIWWGEEHQVASERLEEFFEVMSARWVPEQMKSFDTMLWDHIAVKRTRFENSSNMKHSPESGQFNTDAIALQQRIQSHEKFGSRDLNTWIFDHFHIREGDQILDLGSGTGKQSIPMAKLTGTNGHVLAFDASAEALKILEAEAGKTGIENIKTTCGNLDELDKYLGSEKFDRALASYSLYYAKDPKYIIQVVHAHLGSGGSFFFCGPSSANNIELRKFHNALLKSPPASENRSQVFMEETGPLLGKEIFKKVESFTFENPMEFDSAEALYDYWSSYNLYDKEIDEDFRKAADKHFKTNKGFTTIKRVVGILLQK